MCLNVLQSSLNLLIPVCGKLTDGCSGYADSKEGGAYDRIFPAGTSAAYIYSGNQSVLIIEKY